MIIPKVHYCTQGNSPQELLANIQKACTYGIELVQLVLNGISEKQVSKIAHEAREITSHYQTRLLMVNDAKLAIAIKADGLQLTEVGTAPTALRRQLYSWQMLGGTANTLQHCEDLIAKEVDYIRLGPYRSGSLPDNPKTHLPLKGYRAITDVLKGNIPILAYGPIQNRDMEALVASGIYGVVVSDAITQNVDSIVAFHQLLNASSTAAQRHTFG